MKSVSFLFVFFLSMFSHGQFTKRVLFLGNSYTYVNDLPQLTKDVAFSAGDTLIVDSNTPGGTSFADHAVNTTSLSKIAQGNWDFVVLQEQSQMCSFPIEQVETETYPYAAQLNDSIELYNPCGETMFYMTWGRKNGDASNCDFWPPVCTYEGMDDLIRERYMQLGLMNNALVSPVGAVWRNLRTNHPEIELYNADESHPSAIGSFAGAVCFYTCLFRKDPLLVSYDYTIDNSVEDIIKQTVHEVVYLSMSDWYIGSYDPGASIAMDQLTGFTYQFTATPVFADEISISIENEPISLTNNMFEYTFPGSGTYEMTIIGTKCGVSNTTIYPIQIQSLQTEIFDNDLESMIYPNPAQNVVFFSGLSANRSYDVKLYNRMGQLVCDQRVNANVPLDISQLSADIYTCALWNGKVVSFFKVIKTK